MFEEVSLNATSYGLTSVVSMGNWTPIITVAIMVGLGTTIFMLWKNFRRVVYGLGVSIPIAILGYGSWSIASPMKEGNFTPILWTGGIVGGIFVMMFIGWIAEHFKFIKNIEKALR